jgi:hypothetical protein
VESIYKFVAKQRDSYRSDKITITEGYDFSQYETLRTIELYDNDKFLSGNEDSLGREKPFFNIVSFRKNVATRATDLDTKDVQIQSERITPDVPKHDRCMVRQHAARPVCLPRRNR